MNNISGIGYHAPLRGSHSGVSDYAWTLFEALNRHGRFLPDAKETPLHLYHLGNNRLHEGIYARALETPGAILLHDAVLHHFLLGALSRDRYLKEWTHNYGEWRRDLGEELWEQRGSSSVDPRYFRFPMLRRVAETAKLVLVHNPGAAAIASNHGASNVVVVPHFVETRHQPDALATLNFRALLGIPANAFVFGVFGYLRETKRVVPCLRALRRLHAIRPNTALLIAGECVSSELERLLEAEASQPGVYRIGHLPDHQFLTAAASIDCCLNLRYPAAGETSGIAVRMMGLEKPVLLTESLENSDFPPGSYIPVTSGIAEDAELFDYMGLVSGNPGFAKDVGRYAGLHIRRYHSLETAAQRIWQALCKLSENSQSSPA